MAEHFNSKGVTMRKIVFGLVCAASVALGADVKQCINEKLIENYITSRMQTDKEYSHIVAIADKDYEGSKTGIVALDPGLKVYTGLLNEDEVGNSACWYRFSFQFHDILEKDIQPYLNQIEHIHADKKRLNKYRESKDKYIDTLKLLKYNEVQADKIVPYAIILVNNIFDEYEEVKRTALVDYPKKAKAYYKKFFKGKPTKQDIEVLTTGIEVPMKYKCKAPASGFAWYTTSLLSEEPDASEIKIDGIAEPVRFKLKKTDDENCDSVFRPAEIVKFAEFKNFVRDEYNEIDIHAKFIQLSDAFKKKLIDKTAKFTFSYNWEKKYPEIVPVPVQ